MRVLIDFTQIPKQKVGVGIYARNLLKGLQQADKNNNYYCLIQDDDNELIGLVQSNNFYVIRINHVIYRKFLLRIIFEQIGIPILCLLKKIHLVHSLHYSYPLVPLRAQKVITIHDLIFVKFPHYHIWIKRLYFRFFLFLLSRLTHQIICVSSFTRNDFIDFYSIKDYKQDRLNVVLLAVEKPVVPPHDWEVISKKMNLHEPYLLYIGTIEPRKNIQRLIEAFRTVINAGMKYQLVIVGKKGWMYSTVFKRIKELNLKDNVNFCGYLSDDEKYILLSRAAIFVYPSLYEGFGLPVLEAIQMKVPVITSNTSSLQEVAGNAALLINPVNTDDLSEAILRLLSDSLLKSKLLANCDEQAKRFSITTMAIETIKIYERCGR